MALKKLTCPHCHGNVHIEPGRGTGTVYCNYCGQTLYFDDGQQRKSVNINQYSHKRYTDDADVIRAQTAYKEADNDKGILKWLAILLVIILTIPFSMMTCERIEEKSNINAGRIRAGSYKDLIGEDYRSVKPILNLQVLPISKWSTWTIPGGMMEK